MHGSRACWRVTVSLFRALHAQARSSNRVAKSLPRAVPVKATETQQPEAVPMANIGLSAELRDAVAASGIRNATEVQALAFAPIREHKDILVASHTGSGKTLAYFLPIVQDLRRQETAEGFVGRPKRPRVVVVAPTRELVDQIGGVAKQLAAHAPTRVAVLTAAARSSQQRKRPLLGPVDVVVSTTSNLLAAVKEGHVVLGDVQYLVVDEADTMFDQGFGPELMKLIAPLKARRGGAALATVLVSATINGPLRQLIRHEFPGMVTAQTTSLHKGITGSRHTFVPIEAGGDRLHALTQMLADDVGKRTMVFCNSVQSCRAVDHTLVEAGFPTVCFHGDVPAAARKTAIAEFTDAAAAATAQQPVLVCTDLAARGIDMPARVDHVINFDMPSNPVWYLHRSGRTARAGAEGAVTSLMQSTMDRTLGYRIELALKNGEPLDQLSALKEDQSLRNQGKGGAAPQEPARAKGNNHRKWKSQGDKASRSSGSQPSRQASQQAGRSEGPRSQRQPPRAPQAQRGRRRQLGQGARSGRRRVGARAIPVALWGQEMPGRRQKTP